MLYGAQASFNMTLQKAAGKTTYDALVDSQLILKARLDRGEINMAEFLEASASTGGFRLSSISMVAAWALDDCEKDLHL